MTEEEEKFICDSAVNLACCGVAFALQTLLGHSAFQEISPTPFTESVCRILHEESRSLPPLSTERCARLTELLNLPRTVGTRWQHRYTEMRRCLQLVSDTDGATTGNPGLAPSGVAAAALVAFRDKGTTQQTRTLHSFGRQTVWCAVTLLRRIMKEAEWPPEKAVSGGEAEAQLAAFAVATITER